MAETIDAPIHWYQQVVTKSQAEVAALSAEVDRLRQSNAALLAALKRLYNSDGCGDHCRNSCPQCQATAAIAAAEIMDIKNA